MEVLRGILLFGLLSVTISAKSVGCPERPTDLVFIMDASSSIWPPNFRKQVKFARHLLDEFDVDQTRCGVVTYSDGAREQVSLGPLGADRFGSIYQLLGGTRTDLALQRAREMFATEARSGASKVAIVLTDGQSENPEMTAAEAKLIHAEATKVIAIGIGRKVDANELRLLASHDDLVFELDSYDALPTIRSRLVEKACHPEPVSQKSCGLHPADVVFALDASGSIWGPDFDSQLEFVNDLVGSFTVGPDGVRVGVATFGTHPKQQFNLNSYDDVSDIQTATSHITQSRGSTNTANALHSVRREFFEEQGRTGVVKVAIVITDGQSNEPQATARQAELMREAGVHVFAIGVGRNVAKEELEAIASQPSSSHVFTVDSFRALESISFVLAARACEVTDELTSTAASTPTSSLPSTSPSTSTTTPTSSTTTTTTATTTKTQPAAAAMLKDQETCVIQPLDAVFALSSTADRSSTAHDLAFIQAITYNLDVNEASAHVGLQSKDCSPLLGFKLADGQSRSEVDDLLRLDRYSSEDVTSQLKRLRLESFSSAHGAREEARMVGVLVVDSAPVNLAEAKHEAWLAKREGIELVIIAVGDVGLTDEKLGTLASSGNHVYRVSDHCDLMSIADHLTQRLSRQVCTP